MRIFLTLISWARHTVVWHTAQEANTPHHEYIQLYVIPSRWEMPSTVNTLLYNFAPDISGLQTFVLVSLFCLFHLLIALKFGTHKDIVRVHQNIKFWLYNMGYAIKNFAAKNRLGYSLISQFIDLKDTWKWVVHYLGH